MLESGGGIVLRVLQKLRVAAVTVSPGAVHHGVWLCRGCVECVPTRQRHCLQLVAVLLFVRGVPSPTCYCQWVLAGAVLGVVDVLSAIGVVGPRVATAGFVLVRHWWWGVRWCN